MIKSLFCVMAALWLAASAAAEDKTIPYARFADLSKRLAAATKYDLLAIRIRVVLPSQEKKLSELTFTIPTGPAAPLILRPQEDGTLDLPNDPALTKANPQVTVNIPKEAELRLTVDLRIKLPSDPKAISYAYLDRALEQLDDLTGDQAGMMSFMAPSAKGVRIFCGVGCKATLSTNPAATYPADDRGVIALTSADIPSRRDAIVTLTQPATLLRPVVR